MATKLFKISILTVSIIIFGLGELPAKGQETIAYQVQLGDSWEALALRFGVDSPALQQLNLHPNRQRQPAIGRTIALPGGFVERSGRLRRPIEGGVLQAALTAGLPPWQLALHNGLDHPTQPLLGRLLWIPGEGVPRELPPGILTLELSQVPGRAGEALALRGRFERPPDGEMMAGSLLALGSVKGKLHPTPRGDRFIGLLATGAFFKPGEPELQIQLSAAPFWSQPWIFADKEWTFNQITLTGSAAAISQEAIQAERERLSAVWSEVSPLPMWRTPFMEPVDEFLSYSSRYGARRSYNGGPYSTYHEGLDYAAYAGTAVYVPAAGTVVVAETLYVRGGAVILDHGLAVYSGYYHLSDVQVEAGQVITAGEKIGEVGSTGLSTGNHLHWDLLVNGTWIDPAAWLTADIGCWILEGWGDPCTS